MRSSLVLPHSLTLSGRWSCRLHWVHLAPSERASNQYNAQRERHTHMYRYAGANKKHNIHFCEQTRFRSALISRPITAKLLFCGDFDGLSLSRVSGRNSLLGLCFVLLPCIFNYLSVRRRRSLAAIWLLFQWVHVHVGTGMMLALCVRAAARHAIMRFNWYVPIFVMDFDARRFADLLFHCVHGASALLPLKRSNHNYN